MFSPLEYSLARLGADYNLWPDVFKPFSVCCGKDRNRFHAALRESVAAARAEKADIFADNKLGQFR